MPIDNVAGPKPQSPEAHKNHAGVTLLTGGGVGVGAGGVAALLAASNPVAAASIGGMIGIAMVPVPLLLVGALAGVVIGGGVLLTEKVVELQKAAMKKAEEGLAEPTNFSEFLP